MRYLLFGGTFNPVHVGHIISALEIRDMFLIDKVIFIPNGVPPHKNVLISAQDRYDMVAESISNIEGFEISDIETKSYEENYSYKTIRYFKELYKYDDLFFCIGADAFLHIDTWQEWKKLLKMITFIIITRPGYNMSKIVEKYKLNYIYVKREGRYPSNDLFTYVYYKKIDISSTEIRERVKDEKTIKYYVSPLVEEMIYKKGFYK
jgi:nicotinate-nucleotide adenylyltransferase